MPTYEYKCDGCGHRFEKFQSMSAAPIRRCPNCHKNKVRRLIGTGAGLIFKGSGFYITDYRDASYKEKAKAESGGGGDAKDVKPAAEGDAKKADAKPADAKPAAEASPKIEQHAKRSSAKPAKKK
jgi:putative FmdB family regulatory protein